MGQFAQRYNYVRNDSYTWGFDIRRGMIDDDFAAFLGGIDFQNSDSESHVVGSSNCI